jgi:hypothetical protein
MPLSGSRFVDPDFAPGPASLGSVEAAGEVDDTWLEVTEIVQDAALATRKDGSTYVFDANDVAQVSRVRRAVSMRT